MKPLKMLKAKKLVIKKETLRTLTESDLRRVGGGYMNTGSGCGWCSTSAHMKCSPSVLGC